MVRFIAICVFAVNCPLSMAGVVLHTTTGAFNTAVSGMPFAGTEDWESSTLGSNAITSFPAPLAPGIANGPFPNGTNAATGLTVQENSLAGNPTNTTAPGNLATASDGLSGTPTDQVSTNALDVSFDMLFGLPTTAVSLTPLVFDQDVSGDAGTATVRVYNSSNTLIGTFANQPVAGFMNPTTFLGLVANGGDTIGRINLFATSAGDQFTGADNINVYAVPEPSAFLFLGLIAFGGIAYRWQRRLGFLKR